MEVIIDGQKYVPEEKSKAKGALKPIEGLVAEDDAEATKLYNQYVPLCPECGLRGFPTNFSAVSFGGEKDDKRTVWFCSEMGHCAFSITKEIKWAKRPNET